MIRKIRFAIHPGSILSRDGHSTHHHDYHTIIRLYHVNPIHCILWDDHNPDTYRGRRTEDYIHLYAHSGDDHQEILTKMIENFEN